MIDFLKIHALPVSASAMLRNELLTFPLSNVSTSGELIKRPQTADYRGLKISIRPGGQVSLRGSLHKYNEGGTNYQDFSLNDTRTVIKELSGLFRFNPDKALVNFIEIGVNIDLETSPTELIKTLVMYRNSAFEALQVKGKGFGKICNSQRFVIKVYDKSKQYSLNSHLLRFELKIKKTEFLKIYGIENLTLSDLCRADLWPTFEKILIDTLEGVLLFDSNISPDSFSNPKDRELFIEGRYPQFWSNLDRYKKSRLIKKFSELAGSELIKSDLKNRILEKCNKLTTFQESHQIEKVQQINHFLESDEKPKVQHINPKVNGYFVAYCPITNLPILNQKPGSRFLSNKGIRYYYENAPEIYLNQLEVLLTKKWKDKNRDENKEVWFLEIYHQIRNRANDPRNNPRNNTKNSFKNLEAKGLKLWPTMDIISQQKLQLIS